MTDGTNQTTAGNTELNTEMSVTPKMLSAGADAFIKAFEAGNSGGGLPSVYRAMASNDHTYARLRAAALCIIRDKLAWKHHSSDLYNFLAAMSDYADDLWSDYRSVKYASEGQWFAWRDPSDLEGGVHVDRVGVADDGAIQMKYGCGLSFATECQPCRFPEDVRKAIEAAEGQE